jgi:hypothetical protein
MKQLLHLILSYIRDSKALLEDPNMLYIPPGAKIFMADTSAMYTNIDTAVGIHAISDLLASHHNSIPLDFPMTFFLNTLEIVMNNNIFSFRDTFWHQLKGTAMGPPAAPLYSIISFGQHENTQFSIDTDEISSMINATYMIFSASGLKLQITNGNTSSQQS